MAGRTGYTPITNASPMQGPAQITKVYEWFDPLIGESRPTVSALPTTGNFLGRTIYVADQRTPYVWDGTTWQAFDSHTDARYRTMSALNEFGNKTSYTDFPTPADKSALDMTFVKRSSATKLVIQVAGSAKLASGVEQQATLALNIGGTAYPCARAGVLVAPSRVYLNGTTEVSGIGAGSLAIKPQFAATNASAFQFQGGDSVSYSVTETL
jgi:hypothetical protein